MERAGRCLKEAKGAKGAKECVLKAWWSRASRDDVEDESEFAENMEFAEDERAGRQGSEARSSRAARWDDVSEFVGERETCEKRAEPVL